MRGTSRDALARAQERFEESIGSLPDGAGSMEVSEGLYAVAALLDREPSLRRAFADPASSPETRRGLAQNLLGDQLAPLPLSVLLELVEERWADPADLRESVEVLAANAALRAAEGEGSLDDVEDELFRFGRLLEREPELRAALNDPGLPAERKTALLGSLLGSARPTTLRLVEIAVTRRHGLSLEHALDQLSELAARRRQRSIAQVRVAAPLTAEQEQRLARALTRVYGREVDVQIALDPSVVGGVEVRVGDEVVDGTVRHNLNAVERRLAG